MRGDLSRRRGLLQVHVNLEFKKMRAVIEIHEGHLVRNLLENGLLNMLQASQVYVALVTPATGVASFVSRYGGQGIEFYDLGLLDGARLSNWENFELAMGRRLSLGGYHRLRRFLWRWLAEPLVAQSAQRERDFLERQQPDVVVSTHISQIYGRKLVVVANQMGIPTVGNLNSWDNTWKGLKVRPKLLTCWSNNNKAELCKLASYLPEQVRLIGAPAFDSYFALGAKWTRAELCAKLGLDAKRPILLFATLGQFKQQIDETNPLEVLLRAVDAAKIPNRPQVVVRMHPWSRETYFGRLLRHSSVTVSRYENYIPGLTWTPTKDEVVLAGNLLRHADVVISPGSTMSIESAIFDTPTIVPVFNEYLPESYSAYVEKMWLTQHFKQLYINEWVPVLRSGRAMVEEINRALTNPNLYAEGRAKIREEILGPLDGKATERFAKVIIQAASGNEKPNA